VRLGLNPEVNALGTLFIAAVTVAVVLNNHWMLKRQRRRDLQMAQALRTQDGTRVEVQHAA
jgi:putrescine transport system permease protein